MSRPGIHAWGTVLRPSHPISPQQKWAGEKAPGGEQRLPRLKRATFYKHCTGVFLIWNKTERLLANVQTDKWGMTIAFSKNSGSWGFSRTPLNPVFHICIRYVYQCFINWQETEEETKVPHHYAAADSSQWSYNNVRATLSVVIWSPPPISSFMLEKLLLLAVGIRFALRVGRKEEKQKDSNKTCCRIRILLAGWNCAMAALRC